VYPVSPQDPWVQVSEVIRLIRSGEAQTRPELADATRLGRNIITQRIQAAQDIGLVRPSGQQRSRGGRAAEVWEFAADRGRVLSATINPDHLRVAVSDLNYRIIEDRILDRDPGADPERTCELIAGEMDELLAAHHDGPAWGIGIGVPTHVDVTTGQAVAPVTSGPGAVNWAEGLNVRNWFTRRMQAPVWLDSLPNLSALGAATADDAPDTLVFVRMDRSIGSGIVAGGRLHRGADSIAGEIAHVSVHPDADRICLCGRVGCLDAYASQWAIETEAARILRRDTPTGLTDVVAAAQTGDPGCAELVLRAADATGRALAGMITWFNPRRVVIGGNALATSSLFQAAVSRTLNAQTLAAAVQHLELRPGTAERTEEIVGATALVTDVLLTADYLAEWGPHGFPIDIDRLLAKHPSRD